MLRTDKASSPSLGVTAWLLLLAAAALLGGGALRRQENMITAGLLFMMTGLVTFGSIRERGPAFKLMLVTMLIVGALFTLLL